MKSKRVQTKRYSIRTNLKYMSVNEKIELEWVNRENLRLYQTIVRINNSPQYGYLGLHKSRLNPKNKKLEAGFGVKMSPIKDKKEKSIEHNL